MFRNYLARFYEWAPRHVEKRVLLTGQFGGIVIVVPPRHTY